MIAMDEKPKTEPAKRRQPQVFADPCKACGSTNTRVARTMMIVRYCKCRVCGTTWTQTPRRP